MPTILDYEPLIDASSKKKDALLILLLFRSFTLLHKKLIKESQHTCQ